MTRLSTLAGLLASLSLLTPAYAADKLELKPGDHVCVIGNTLADRMQHDGWLEALLQARFPKHKLVYRDLGFAADELTVRPRSASFGSPDHWLGLCKADVVFAFFGYNESFGGTAGLDRFKKDLEAFIKNTLAQKYNGKSAPRLVLFSPIAHEDLRSPHLPDGADNNKRLALYSAAMAEVARASNVVFVDLFKPTQELYPKVDRPLTINGIHLTPRGNRAVAEVIDRALFGGEPGGRLAEEGLRKLRQAVRDKNHHWFNRYRTVDGYSIYGGRADEPRDGQTNRANMAREMEVLDVMTANRDKRVWARAQGGDLEVDDSNTPPFIEVRTNRPGKGPNGTHVFLGGEEAIKKMTVARGMKVTLFASEEKFPELAKPVQMAFDPQGRLWVAAWPSYPHWKPREEMNDKLLIFEDTDGDGKADKCTPFAEGLHCPTGFEFYNGGVLVAQAPDLLYLKDTDGDGKADVRQRVLHGLDSADTHHTANSFVLDPGGALYFQEGTFHRTGVETPWGPAERCADGGVFRYEPRSQKFEVYVACHFANPHGHVFDRWGQDIVVDGTGAQPYHAPLFSGRVRFPDHHPRPPQVYQQRTRPCPGMEYLSSRHFPEANQGNLLVANVIGFQGILQYKIHDKGASFGATEAETIVYSSDANFRPSDVKVGPDGAIWFIDWHNPLIGHLQHNLRDPSRDRTHGRVYRVTVNDRPLNKPEKIAGAPLARLFELLRHPEDRVRYRTRIELGGRDSKEVLASVKKWADGLDRKDADYEHCVLEALWLHQSHDVVDVELLKRVLGSPEFRARAAATRVLCYWRDRVPGALELLKKLAADEHPRVRLEAVRAASFFTEPEALEVALITAEQPADLYVEFARGETLKTLEPIWKKALAEGRPVNFTSEAGARFFLRTVTTDDLLKIKRSRPVYLELLLRPGVRDEHRQEALTGLAKLDKKSDLQVLLATLAGLEDMTGRDESVGFDLVRLLTSRPVNELTAVRGELEKMATRSRQSVTRQLGFVALVAADGGADRAWELAQKSATALRDFLGAVPLFRDPAVRTALYPKVEPLLDGLPKHLVTGTTARGVTGRYVRIELPGRRRTLTLAEVEVQSDGRNVARAGKATQANTAHGGSASRAIDGNTNPSYADGGQTHTRENTADPWWEVDLGSEMPIDSIVIYNRTDGDLGGRLDGYTLKVLDNRRAVVLEKEKQAAPTPRATFEVGGGGAEASVRRAAMTALASVRGQEAAAFGKLAKFVKDGVERHAAVLAIERIPGTYWPREEAKPLLDSLLGYVRKLPLSERTTPAALDAIHLAESLAALLPLDEARAARKEIGAVGVRVVRIGTVHDQMLFDKERFAVKAGRPFELVFENTDLMPHNLVITEMGALEEVGNLAEAQATQPGAIARHYVPVSNKVLWSTRMLQPRGSQKLSITAPKKPGVYPYVCTFPGHWRRMYGAMYVVEDLEAYQADPEGYLAKNPLPVSDELLKLVRPRKEWKFEELSAVVEKMESGRSFNHAKQVFTVANCVACHKLNGAGQEIGPDLAKLDPKLKRADILRELLDPSAKINEKFQSYVFELQSGKVVTGLILEEKPDQVKIIENPLARTAPLVLKPGDIADRKKSPTSIMPKGLMDKLTLEEILDLIAYVEARGDAKHKLFQGGHDHGGGHGHH